MTSINENFPELSRLEEKNLLSDLARWLMNNYSDYDFLDAIESSSREEKWLSITTNISFDDRRWQDLLKDFESEQSNASAPLSKKIIKLATHRVAEGRGQKAEGN